MNSRKRKAEPETRQPRPVVGILTAGRGSGGVPGNRQMFRYVLQACQKEGIHSYVFTPGQLQWSKGMALGYQWRGGRFVLGRHPLPNVVYNRVPNRALEHSPAVTALKRQLRSRGIPCFNPRFLNKHDLYRVLVRQSEAAPYLPWTARLRRMDDLDRALRRFGSIYLKPKNSFAGQGIMRVSLGQGNYHLRYRVKDANRRQVYKSKSELFAAIRAMAGQKTYMLQQAIELARYQGRIFDVRLLAQKNQSGSWQVTGMGIRVASKGGITTHVPNGGFIASTEQVLPRVFPDSAGQVEERVRALAMTVAPLVERGYHASFGEMSMDIGITPDGRPFFFEANAKPMKFDEDRIRHKGLSTLVSYMRYLARTRRAGADG
ncbi:MAG: YheC/YheD family protein [Bacillota bacterium]|jgi:hypothetical protein